MREDVLRLRLVYEPDEREVSGVCRDRGSKIGNFIRIAVSAADKWIMRQTIRFEINQPVTVALESPEGVRVAGHNGPQVKFFLTEERVMYAVPDLADAIRILGVKPGEPFTITKRWESDSGRKPWWDLERVKSPWKPLEHPGTPRTPTDTPKTQPNPVSASAIGIIRSDSCSLPASDKKNSTPSANAGDVTSNSANASLGSQSQPNQPTPAKRGPTSETHGPVQVPPHSSGMHLTRNPPLKPSYEEAFRECLRIVTTGLGDAREQWSDSAKQAMVSTLLIQLGRENRLGEFRPQATAKVA